MNGILIKHLYEIKPKQPILIEGLPGVGNVGKLAAQHLIDETNAKKIIEIYSKHFPPQVFVTEEGLISQVKNEIYYLKNPELLIITGDYQGITSEGQYELTSAILDICEKYGVKMIYTLGGYGTGRMVDNPKVIGAATNEKLIEKMKKYGVIFSRGEPGSGIIGAAGLLLGLGKLRDMDGVCLMGETSGYLVDPKSARAVLEILISILGLSIDFSKLEEKASQIDTITSKMKQIEEKELKELRKEKEIGYIG